MAEGKGMDKVNLLRQRWISYQLASITLLSLAFTVIIGSILHFIFGVALWYAVVVFIACLALLLLLHQPWKITNRDITSFLNRNYPELEESSGLMLKPVAELNILEKLQLPKTETALNGIPATPADFLKPLKKAGIFVIVAFLIGIAIAKSHQYLRSTATEKTSTSNATKLAAPEKILPQIEAVNLIITPPAYTGKPQRNQDKFTLMVEEGAGVQWQISTNIAIKTATLLFNEHEQVTLHSSNNNTRWTAQKQMSKPGFYQVIVDGKLSDLYQIEVIKDSAPVIRIKTPKQYTYIDAGEAQKVTLSTNITDDYGIKNAMIFATVAKGSGEGVKFKEYKINFDEGFQQHKAQYDLQKLFDLPKLNMEPGDELYFYVQAQDTHQQLSRTDVYIVSIQDTAQLLSMDGIVTGANLKPEYFRSQRQIILDTEQLLKEKDTISAESFHTRCNNIGIDQKMLRLRYGKFLGEEDENQVGEIDKNSELSKAENFNNADMLVDAYTDKHDNAEDATFLEPAIKTQLKATLTEMWNSELRLRLYKPLEALPFEYKALRLLKDLQQKSRSYVAKTAYNPPPLKMEKRMSADLSKIVQPVTRGDMKAPVDQFENLKKGIVVLAQLKATGIMNATDKHSLQMAGAQISMLASAQPGMYLSAVSAIRRILTDGYKVNNTDIAIAGRAMQKALPRSGVLPQAQTNTAADMGLSKGYYKNLNHNR